MIQLSELRRRIEERFYISLFFHVLIFALVFLVVLLSYPSRSWAASSVQECFNPALQFAGNVIILYLREDGSCNVVKKTTGDLTTTGIQDIGGNIHLYAAVAPVTNYRWDGASYVADGYGALRVNDTVDAGACDSVLAFNANSSDRDVLSKDGGTIDYAGITGTYDEDDVVCGDGYISSVVLTSSGTTFTTGDSVDFNVTWSNLDDVVYNIFFYRDPEITDYVKIVDNYAVSGNSWNFSQPYFDDGTYVPYVQLGNEHCSTPTASGCVLYEDTAPSITISNPIDYSTYYTNIFTIEQTSYVQPNQPYEYEWNLDSQLCGLDSFSGATLYLDGVYPPFTSSGYTLATQFGTGSLTFRYPLPLNSSIDPVYPKIVVECTPSGIQKTVYLGGSMTSGLPVTFWVVGTFQIPETWTSGGSDGTFQSGSGYGLWAEKSVYEKSEAVKLRWKFSTPLVVDSVALIKDSTNTGAVIIYDGDSDISEGNFHYGIIQYNTAGEYSPFVQLRTATFSWSDPTTYRNIHLGGGQYSDGINVITVKNTFYGAVTDYFSFIGTGATTQNTNNMYTYGIFGLPASTFYIDFGNDTFWAPIGVVVNQTIRFLVWLASKSFYYISQAPFFNVVHDLIVPPEGTSGVLPSYYLGQEVNISTLGFTRAYTVDYPEASGGREYLLPFLYFIFASTLMFYILNRVF